MITNDEWIIINHLITGIYKIVDEKAMRYFFLNQINRLIDLDCADFYIPASGKDKNKNRTVHNPVYISNIGEEKAANFIRDYNSTYYKMDYFNWINYARKSFVYREEDILSIEYRESCPYYSDYLKVYDLVHVAAMCINSHEACVGAVTLYRREAKGAFSDRDMFILNQLEPHLNTRLHNNYRQSLHIVDPGAALRVKYDLTDRETEIALRGLKGLSNTEIAQALNVSMNTVKKHFSNILSKTNVKNRVQLIQLLIDEGLLPEQF